MVAGSWVSSRGRNHKHSDPSDPRPAERHLSGSGTSPADHATKFHLITKEPFALCWRFAVGFGVTVSKKKRKMNTARADPKGDFWKTVTCCPHLNQNQIAGLFRPASLRAARVHETPLCCLMGSWPRGRGYSLSFLQLAFTVSLAELMRHIFEAQVPCAPPSDLRAKLK